MYDGGVTVAQTARFYHWARCSTCRDARKALSAAGRDAVERDFFKDPLAREEIMRIASLVSVSEMFSWNSPSSKPYRDRKGEMSDDELVTLMLNEPRLVRRPILIIGDRVLFGFRAREYEAALKSES
jgi:Spx/MgsR family transcriptional regulator